MKNLIFISSILIIFLKTGNVLSNTNIFNVNNIEINKDIYKNKEKLVNKAFQEGFKKLIKRLLLEDDFNRLNTVNLEQIKKLISHYQIVNPDEDDDSNDVKINIFFNKNKMHEFFYINNTLYSDVINSNVTFFPFLIKKDKDFFYTNNYFYKNWNLEKFNNLIEYTLPIESIESIQMIKENKDNIYRLNISEFFLEYDRENLVFAIIEIIDETAKVFLKTKILDKELNKTLIIKNENLKNEDFNNMVISKIKNQIHNLIKSQNLIDVRTPSFLNFEIKLEKKENLVKFKNKIKKIDLIDEFYIQEMNKDFVLIKIKYLGKISKIIKKLEDQDINLKIKNGQWQLSFI